MGVTIYLQSCAQSDVLLFGFKDNSEISDKNKIEPLHPFSGVNAHNNCSVYVGVVKLSSLPV